MLKTTKRKNISTLSTPNFSHIFIDTLNMCAIEYYSKRFLSYDGFPTGMLFGVAKNILYFQKMFKNAKLVFLWEGFNSIRKQNCVVYKAQRKKTDNAFRDSIQDVHVLLDFLDVEQWTHSGLEADDLAAFAVRKSNVNVPLLLVSNDRDWWSFAAPNVSFFIKHEIVTYEEICQRLSFSPDRLPLYKAICGDASDNILGVPRFPTRLAVSLVNYSPSLSLIFTVAENGKWNETDRKWMNLLLDHRELVEHNYYLSSPHVDLVSKKFLYMKKGLLKLKKVDELLKQRGIMSLRGSFKC